MFMRCEINPIELGPKVTLIVQVAPALTEEPQLLVSEKGPLAEAPEKDKLDAPVLVKVKVCAVLVLPTLWPGKVRLVVDRRTDVFGTTADTVIV